MRHTSARRLRALGSAALVGVAIGVLPGPAAAESRPASSSLTARVAALNADIDRVGAELAEGAMAYEEAAQEMVRLTQEQFAAGADHDAMQSAAADSRSVLAGLARSAYKGEMPPAVTALLSGDPRALSNLAYVRKSVNRLGASRGALARDLGEQQAGAGRALAQSDTLRRAALVQRQALDGQLQALAARTDQLTAELTAAAALLAEARAAEQVRAVAAQQAQAVAEQQAQAREAQARVLAQLRDVAQRSAAASAASRLAYPTAAGATVRGLDYPVDRGAYSNGGACQPASPYGEANGFLSDAGVCPLAVGGGHRLRTDAAAAFDALSRARQAATGAPLCVTDSYRSFPEQVDVFKRKPGLAATPGRSQHGWGLAVDLCGGVQTFGAEPHLWMQANAPQYGWVHPGWAQQAGSRPEAWHWEYVG